MSLLSSWKTGDLIVRLDTYAHPHIEKGQLCRVVAIYSRAGHIPQIVEVSIRRAGRWNLCDYGVLDGWRFGPAAVDGLTDDEVIALYDVREKLDV